MRLASFLLIGLVTLTDAKYFPKCEDMVNRLQPAKPPDCVDNSTDCSLNIQMAGKMTQVLHLPASFEWPDNAGGEIEFVVHAHFTIAHVVLTLHDFRHAYAGDVSMELKTPWGDKHELIHAEPHAGHCGEDHFGSQEVCLNYCPGGKPPQLWSESDTDYQERILIEDGHGQDIGWHSKPGCNELGGAIKKGTECSTGVIECCNGASNPYCNIKTTGIYSKELSDMVQTKKAYGTWTVGIHDHFLRDIGYFAGATLTFYPCADWTCPGMAAGNPILGPPYVYDPHYGIQLLTVPNQNGEFELFVDKEGKQEGPAYEGQDYDTPLFYFKAPADGLTTYIEYRVLLNCRPSWTQRVNITVSAAPPVADKVWVSFTAWNSAVIEWEMRRPEFESFIYINGKRIDKKLPPGTLSVDIYKDLGVWLPNSTYTIFTVKLAFMGLEGPESSAVNTTTCLSWCNNCTGKGLSMGIPYYNIKEDRWYKRGPFMNFCFDCVKVTPIEWGPQVPKVYRDDKGNGICIDDPSCPNQYWEKWDDFVKNFVCWPCAPCGLGRVRRGCFGLEGGHCEGCADVHKADVRHYYKDFVGSSLSSCTPCTECKKDKYANTPCSSTHDLTCGFCPEHSHTTTTGSIGVTSCFCAPGWYLFLDKCSSADISICLVRECRECGLGCQKCEQGNAFHHAANLDTVCMKPFKGFYLMNYGVTVACGHGWVHTYIYGVDKNNESIAKFGEQCHKCESCPPGQIRINCKNATVGTCVACPKESYKLEYHNWDSACSTCTTCKLNEYVDLPCLATQDRKCEPCGSCTYGQFRVGCGSTYINATLTSKNETRLLGYDNPGPGTCAMCADDYFKSVVGDWTTACTRCSKCRGNLEDGDVQSWVCIVGKTPPCALRFPLNPEDVPAIPCGSGIRFKKADIPYPCLGCDSCPWGSYKSTPCDRISQPPVRAICASCVGCGKGQYRVNCGNNGTEDYVKYDSDPGQCLNCAAGRFKNTDAAGSTWWDDGCRPCTYCESGRWTEKICWAEADTTPCQNCGECKFGTYISSNCNETSPHLCSSCTLCGKGQYLKGCKASITVVGIDSHLGVPGYCEPCEVGKYKNWVDLKAWNGSIQSPTQEHGKCVPCSKCPLNMYADFSENHHCIATRDIVQCKPCPNAGGCLTNGSYVSDACNSAASGGSNVGGPICTTCEACPAGTFRSGCSPIAPHLGGGPGFCAKCPEGKFKQAGIEGNHTDTCHGCTPCAAGLSPADGYHCRANADIVLSKCTTCYSCGVGKFINDDCNTLAQVKCFSCNVCPAGQFRPHCNATHPGVCQNCPSKMFKAFEGGWDTTCSPCRECQAGRFATVGCTLTANTKECTYCGQCDAMEYESSRCNASSPPVCAKCETCIPGMFLAGCVGRDHGTCKACPIYTFKEKGLDGVTTDGCSSCGVCARNSFQTVACTSSKNVECKQCPIGSVSNGGSTALARVDCTAASGFFLTIDAEPTSATTLASLSLVEKKSIAEARVAYVPCFGGCLSCKNGYTCEYCPKGRALLAGYSAMCTTKGHCIDPSSPMVTAKNTLYTIFQNATICIDVHTCEEKTATWYNPASQSCNWCTDCKKFGSLSETAIPCSERLDAVCQIRNDTFSEVQETITASRDEISAGFIIAGLSLFGLSTVITVLALIGGALMFVHYRKLRHAHKYAKGIDLSHLHFGHADVNVTHNIAVAHEVSAPGSAGTWRRKHKGHLRWEDKGEPQKEPEKESLGEQDAFSRANMFKRPSKKGAKKKATSAKGIEMSSIKAPAFSRRVSGVQMSNPMLSRMRSIESSKRGSSEEGSKRSESEDSPPPSPTQRSAPAYIPPPPPSVIPTLTNPFAVAPLGSPILAVAPLTMSALTPLKPAGGSGESQLARMRKKKAMMRRRSDAFEGIMGDLGVDKSEAVKPQEKSTPEKKAMMANMRRRSNVFEGLMDGF